MGFTSYEWDVFISYVHADNVPDMDDRGLVEIFCEKLRGTLRAPLGGTEPSIFFDKTTVAANHQLDRLLAAARNSAVFVAVASSNYASRKWTKDELAAFVGQNTWNDSYATRLFGIDFARLPDDRSFLPKPLDTVICTPFWEAVGADFRLLRPADSLYFRNVERIARDIARKLVELHEARTRPPPQVAAVPIPGRTVLLAQPSGDLEDACEQVRSHLEQYGITVLPAQDYPQGGAEFRAGFAADLARAKLFVQLLGPKPGRRPPDLPEGYTRCQAEAATASRIDMLQWREPGLVPDNVPDPDYRALLHGEHVIVDTLEGFKAAVVQKMTRPPLPASPPPGPSFVFIDAAAQDIDLAKQVQRIFPNSAVPALAGDPSDVQADLEENIVDCDALILVNGQATPTWMRAQLRLCRKLTGKRSQPLRVLELIVEPPEKREDHGMTLAVLRQIRVQAPLDPESLQPIALALHA